MPRLLPQLKDKSYIQIEGLKVKNGGYGTIIVKHSDHIKLKKPFVKKIMRKNKKNSNISSFFEQRRLLK